MLYIVLLLKHMKSSYNQYKTCLTETESTHDRPPKVCHTVYNTIQEIAMWEF